ncbi:hypothetical protein GOP47_0023027 [Adiantum capillus-veneris]|uniref:Uncharacterized protein n=1 Tax=Adiantum capillus-veneris TaxID=13818 RepID=A0A9D4U6P9_ADICA|nr:hypothetical protein GOP47_0023027 [Adiantum capillus-veneris]
MYLSFVSDATMGSMHLWFTEMNLSFTYSACFWSCLTVEGLGSLTTLQEFCLGLCSPCFSLSSKTRFQAVKHATRLDITKVKSLFKSVKNYQLWLYFLNFPLRLNLRATLKSFCFHMNGPGRRLDWPPMIGGEHGCEIELAVSRTEPFWANDHYRPVQETQSGMGCFGARLAGGTPLQCMLP